MVARLHTNYRRIADFLPLVGSVLFIILYLLATMAYPGGNQADSKSKGFSWLHNYWCNLLHTQAINGEVNTARPIALLAMLILAISVSIFWYRLPSGMSREGALARSVRTAGPLTMFTSMFVLGTMHDLVINVAGIMGLIALYGTMRMLYDARWRGLFLMGMIFFALVVANNICYYSPGGLLYLPVVQKFTFLYFIVWMCGVQLQVIFLHLRLN